MLVRSHLSYKRNIGLVDKSVWFQQDEAYPHYLRTVHEFFELAFPNRWIGSRKIHIVNKFTKPIRFRFQNNNRN